MPTVTTLTLKVSIVCVVVLPILTDAGIHTIYCATSSRITPCAKVRILHFHII